MADINIREKINEIALKFAEQLKDHIHLHSLYVYGSYANGTFTDESDIDIAVVADGFSGDIVEDTFMLMKIRRNIDNRIEPHPFLTQEFNDTDPMAKEVMHTGIRII